MGSVFVAYTNYIVKRFGSQMNSKLAVKFTTKSLDLKKEHLIHSCIKLFF
jgi:hypothetical protein